MLRVVLAVLLLTTGGNGTDAGIVAVVPNPVAQNDRGEYVVPLIPTETNLSEWSIADGESVVRLPDRPGGGRIRRHHRPFFSGAVADPAGGRCRWPPRVGERRRAPRTPSKRQNGRPRDLPTGPGGPPVRSGQRWMGVAARGHDRSARRPGRPVDGGGVRAARRPQPHGTGAGNRSGPDSARGIYLRLPQSADVLCRGRKRGVTVRLVVDSGPTANDASEPWRRIDRPSYVTIARITSDGVPPVQYESPSLLARPCSFRLLSLSNSPRCCLGRRDRFIELVAVHREGPRPHGGGLSSPSNFPGRRQRSPARELSD